MSKDPSQYVLEKLESLAGKLSEGVRGRNWMTLYLAARQVGAFEPFLAQAALSNPQVEEPFVKNVKKARREKRVRNFILNEKQIKVLDMVFGLEEGSDSMRFVDVVRKICPEISDSLVSVGGTVQYINLRGTFNMAMRRVEYVIKNHIDIEGLQADNSQFYKCLFEKRGSDFENLAKIANYNQESFKKRKHGRKKRKRPFRTSES